MSLQIQCPKCGTGLLAGSFNQPGLTPCQSCGAPLQVEVFPAFFRKSTPGQSGQAVMLEGESSCFYHPLKKAVTPCDGCGRFLCALCDCELNGRHFCPGCLETGRSKGKIKSLENQRTRYDSIALALALFPILFFYFTIVTAPMTLFVVIRYWKVPSSIVRRSRFRFILAATVAVLQIGGWTAFFIAIAYHKSF